MIMGLGKGMIVQVWNWERSCELFLEGHMTTGGKIIMSEGQCSTS